MHYLKKCFWQFVIKQKSIWMLNLGIGRRWKTRKKPDILVHIKICKYRCFSHHILPEVSASFHKHFFGTTMSQTNTTSNELGYHKLTSLLIDRTLNFQLFINQDDVKLNCILKESICQVLIGLRNQCERTLQHWKLFTVKIWNDDLMLIPIQVPQSRHFQTNYHKGQH